MSLICDFVRRKCWIKLNDSPQKLNPLNVREFEWLVLIPETAINLIQEDITKKANTGKLTSISARREQATKIWKESQDYGAYLFPDAGL